MTSGKSEIEPRLRELLGDVGEQRENVLLQMASIDIRTLAERAGGERVARTAEPTANVEARLRESRRSEVAQLLHDAVGQSLVPAPIRCDRLAQMPLGVLAELGIDADTRAPLLRGEISPTAAVELQSIAVRLSPTSAHRVQLGHVLWNAGNRSAAARLAQSLCTEFNGPGPSPGSYALAGMIAAAGFAVGKASSLYRLASQSDPTRLGPALEWLATAIYLGRREDAEGAIQAVLLADRDQALAKSVVRGWTAARADRRWALDVAADELARDLRSHVDPLIAELAGVFA